MTMIHTEQKTLPYTAAQMFDLVAAVDQYDKFLPWCVASRITKRESDTFYADLAIGYKMIREKFSSKVVCDRPHTIHVEYMSGPLQYLRNDWRFTDGGDGSCTIDFYVEFDFKNTMLRKLAEIFFNEAIKRMVQAFEDRAEIVYKDLPPSKSG